MKNILKVLLFFALVNNLAAQDDVTSDPLFDEITGDAPAADFPEESQPVAEKPQAAPSEFENLEEVDDLEQLKQDIGQDMPVDPAQQQFPGPEATPAPQVGIEDNANKVDNQIFQTGPEEKELLVLAESVSHKMSDEEWANIAAASNLTTYTVEPGDWLFKISKKLFGTGFYYPKIWSLNPYIKNPHEIEPGMILVFDPGAGDAPPQVSVGTKESMADADSKWFQEKEELKKQGNYVGFANQEDEENLKNYLNMVENDEYKKYTPPALDVATKIPTDLYDKSGFDKTTKVAGRFKEGFALNTFVSTNVVQDFGELASAINEGNYIGVTDHVYLKFNGEKTPQVGESYSIYSPKGKMSNKNSDREGIEYTIVGDVKILRKLDDLWEAVVTHANGVVERGFRITVYTPKIEKIYKTYNSRVIDGSILGSFSRINSFLSMGDVVYLDRGRADGVEIGNVFEAYDFVDRGKHKAISKLPAYRNGELTVITVTDNFATALVSLSERDFKVGDLVTTKSPERAAKELRQRKKDFTLDSKVEKLARKPIIDVPTDDLTNEMLSQAVNTKLTPEEQAKLDELEKEKGYLTGTDPDQVSLEKLESEVVKAEKNILPQDQKAEAANLEDIEDSQNMKNRDLDALERQVGRKYVDEKLNNKDNPYGLSEYDVETVDELINTEKAVPQTSQDSIDVMNSSIKK